MNEAQKAYTLGMTEALDQAEKVIGDVFRGMRSAIRKMTEEYEKKTADSTEKTG